MIIMYFLLYEADYTTVPSWKSGCSSYVMDATRAEAFENELRIWHSEDLPSVTTEDYLGFPKRMKGCDDSR
ncbi:hypothetical protein [Klebsiella pneumoniae]|uniref:hypothetical protein n=1 Tax=Klebsiella pneumoniae TaxID=573 RepID=UPI001E3E26FA|nr:hypothetical protein [Klebsiella pneumoniae]